MDDILREVSTAKFWLLTVALGLAIGVGGNLLTDHVRTALRLFRREPSTSSFKSASGDGDGDSLAWLWLSLFVYVMALLYIHLLVIAYLVENYARESVGGFLAAFIGVWISFFGVTIVPAKLAEAGYKKLVISYPLLLFLLVVSAGVAPFPWRH